MRASLLFRRLLSGDLAIPFYAAIVKLAIHFYTNAFAGYGIFRDELYYIANTEHLDIGYVDHPPLSIFVLTVSRLICGDSVFGLRLLPALAGAATVFVIGLMTKEMGGGKIAQLAACIGATLAPIYLGMNTIYSMNSFDILLWSLGAFTVIKLVQTDDHRHWIILGVIIGLGALNKISMLWLGAGVGVGVLLTRERFWLKTRRPYAAAFIALLLFLPFIMWNITHNFAHLEFMRYASNEKYVSQTPLTFLGGQFLIHNPIAAPLWLGGLLFLLLHKTVERFRILAIIFLTVGAILIINWHSKAEYLAAAFSIVYAGGGLAIDQIMATSFWKKIRAAYLGLIVLSGIILAPLALPILPVETYIRYERMLGVSGGTSEGNELAQLPQFYADMFGWENLAETVARVYQKLSAEEQAVCAIYGSNYGKAGAIDFFGTKCGLPKAVSFHNNYALWGSRGYSGKVVIAIGGRAEEFKELFESVETAETLRSKYAMPYENNLPIFVCRNVKVPLDSLWANNHTYR